MSLNVSIRACRLWAAALALGAAAAGALAQDRAYSASMYLQAEKAPRHTEALAVGATLPWGDWHMPLWGGELRGLWDLSLNRWSYRSHPGYPGRLWMVAVIPTLRWHPDGGRANWFIQAGVGATWMNRIYHTEERFFSTRFNFGNHLGVGMHLGAQREHELLLQYQHVSNAGIKKPNPGEDALQLRYAYHF